MFDKIDGAMKRASEIQGVIQGVVKKHPGLITLVGIVIIISGIIVTAIAYKQYKQDNGKIVSISNADKRKTDKKTSIDTEEEKNNSQPSDNS